MAELLATRPADGLERIGLALADPIRRGILVELLDGSACPSHLAELLRTSRSNLSNHLACLRGCGLVRARRNGRYLHYELTSPELGVALGALLTVGCSLPECEDQLP